MSRASNRQWIWAFAAGIACIVAVALACPSSWSSTGGAAVAPGAGHDLPSVQAPVVAGNAGDTPPDDVAARVMRDAGTPHLETFAADGEQQGPAADLAARRTELGADELRPDTLITEAAGSRYAALDVQAQAAASQAATKR